MGINSVSFYPLPIAFLAYPRGKMSSELRINRKFAVAYAKKKEREELSHCKIVPSPARGVGNLNNNMIHLDT